MVHQPIDARDNRAEVAVMRLRCIPAFWHVGKRGGKAHGCKKSAGSFWLGLCHGGAAGQGCERACAVSSTYQGPVLRDTARVPGGSWRSQLGSRWELQSAEALFNRYSIAWHVCGDCSPEDATQQEQRALAYDIALSPLHEMTWVHGQVWFNHPDNQSAKW